MTTTQQDSADVSLHETFDKCKLLNERLREQTFDHIKSLETKTKMLEHNNQTYFEKITKLEAENEKIKSELEAVRSDFKNHRDTSQQEYAELQATSQQLNDKLQKKIVDVAAKKEEYKERLDKFASFALSFTPSKALAESGSGATEEQPVDESGASGVLAVSSLEASPHAAVHTPNPVAVLDTSLQNNHFNNSGDEGEKEVENDSSALKKSEEVAGDEDSDEDTSSSFASLSKSDEDVLQDDSDKTASPKKSDDEAEELDENEPGAKEEEEDKDVEEDAKEDVEEDEEDDEEDDDGKNVELPPIAENQPVEADELELLSTPVKKSIEYKSDEDEDGFVTASEDNAASSTRTTRDAESQTRSLRKSKRRSKTSPKKTSSSAKKQKRPVRNQ